MYSIFGTHPGSLCAGYTPGMDDRTPEVAARGEQVLLRYPTPADEGAFVQLVAESEETRQPWVPGPQGSAGTDGPLWFRSLLGANADGRNAKLLVVHIADEALIGGMNINEIVRGAFQSGYLGYWITGRYAGRGHGAEALRLLLGYAFGNLALHRLEANIQPENAASIALVRAVGFRLEGRSPRYLKVAGIWRDHERWAVTREEIS